MLSMVGHGLMCKGSVAVFQCFTAIDTKNKNRHKETFEPSTNGF